MNKQWDWLSFWAGIGVALLLGSFGILKFVPL